MNIGIIGPPTIVHKNRAVKELMFKMKQTFGKTVTIVSGGNRSGIETVVRETAFEFELPYQEFNPSYTGHNAYSALEPDYYAKNYHPSHFFDRYRRMVYKLDGLFIGTEDGVKDGLMLQVMKLTQKKGMKVVLI